jgi:hypothetical protein
MRTMAICGGAILLGASALPAQAREKTPEIRSFVGAFLPTGGQRETLKDAPWLGVQGALEQAPVVGNGTETEPMSSFYRLGRYHVDTGIDSAPATGTGRTIHASPALGNRAFFSTASLRGTMSKHMPLTTDPLEYRFEYAEYPEGSRNEAALTFTPIPITMIAQTEIGVIQYYDPAAPTPDEILTEKHVLVNGPPGPVPPGADYMNAAVVGGWIRVPQNNNINKAAGGLFVSDEGLLANLITSALASFETIDCALLSAGEDAEAEGRVVPREHFFAIRMMVRKWGDPSSEMFAGRVRRVAISNPTYVNISRHPEWNPTPVFSDVMVAMVDLAELTSATGCTRITTALTPLFTAAHPNLGAVTLRLEGGASSARPFALPVPTSIDEQFGTGTPSGWAVTDLTPCSYLVHLIADVLITTGEHEPIPREDYIGFCT